MPRFVHVHDLVPPALPDVCEIAAFPVAVVPYALAALEHRIPKYIWDRDHYVRGVQLVRSLQMAILCGGMKEITERQDSLYRMLATAIYGTEYNVTASEPDLVVEPIIFPTHGLAIDHADSIFGRMEDQRQLLQNALNGTDTPEYARPEGIRDLLEQILLAAEEESNLDPQMLAKLTEIAVLMA